MDRRGFIGGSDIAAMLGISKWMTPYQLWEQKTTGVVELADEKREVFFRRGKRLEPIVIEMLQEEKDVWVLDRSIVHTDAEYPFFRAEVDFSYILPETPAEVLAPFTGQAITGMDIPRQWVGNGDIKTVHPFAASDWGEEDTDEVPAYYLAQFQWGLGITGRSTTKIGALFGADILKTYQTDRDDDLIAEIRKKALYFWEFNVLGNNPPPPVSAEDAQKMMEKFDGFTWKMDDATDEQVRRIVTLREEIKLREAEREQLETAVKLAFVDAAQFHGVELGGKPSKYQIVHSDGTPAGSWNKQNHTSFRSKDFRAEHPVLANDFTKTQEIRVLRLK